MRVDGVDRAEYLGGEQHVIDAHPLDEHLHRLLVVNRHVPIHTAGGILERFQSQHDMTAPVPRPLIGDGPAAVRDDYLEVGEILEHT